jgi:hypothetical protein
MALVDKIKNMNNNFMDSVFQIIGPRLPTGFYFSKSNAALMLAEYDLKFVQIAPLNFEIPCRLQFTSCFPFCEILFSSAKFIAFAWHIFSSKVSEFGMDGFEFHGAFTPLHLDWQKSKYEARCQWTDSENEIKFQNDTLRGVQCTVKLNLKNIFARE